MGTCCTPLVTTFSILRFLRERAVNTVLFPEMGPYLWMRITSPWSLLLQLAIVLLLQLAIVFAIVWLLS